MACHGHSYEALKKILNDWIRKNKGNKNTMRFFLIEEFLNYMWKRRLEKNFDWTIQQFI